MDKNMNGQKQKYRINPNFLIAAAGIILLILFLFVQIAGSLMNTAKTTTAVRITVDDSFTADGWFFRDEVLAEGVSSETVKHIVHSGEKVQKDAALAVVYTDASALEISQKTEVLSDEIALLTSAMQSATNSSDAAKLDQQITAQISSVSSKAQNGIVTGIESETADLRNLCLRRSAGNLDGSALSAQLSTLTTERDSLEKQLVGRSTTVASPASGFFSEVVDGFEDKLTTKALESLTLEDFKALDEKDIDDAKSDRLGKVISDFRWYFAAAVPVDELIGIETGDSLRLRFSQVDDDILVYVHDIRKEKDAEEALLILSGMNITPELVTMRYQSAEIIRASYTGIKVPKSAVKIQVDEDEKQQQGVYILPDSMSRFKPIDVLFEGEDYYVVRQGDNDDNTGLVVGDTIIIKARGLEDMKVIK